MKKYKRWCKSQETGAWSCLHEKQILNVMMKCPWQNLSHKVILLTISPQWTSRTAMGIWILREYLIRTFTWRLNLLLCQNIELVISEQAERMHNIRGKGHILVFVPRISLTKLPSVTFPVICFVLILFHFPLSHPWADINGMHSINLHEAKAFKALNLTVFYFTMGCKSALMPGLEAL